MEVDSPGSPSVGLHSREFQCSGFLAAAPEALCCGREQFEVQRGDLSGASVELRTAGGLGRAAWAELLLLQPPASAGCSFLLQRLSGADCER